jgi:hypothetical protein
LIDDGRGQIAQGRDLESGQLREMRKVHDLGDFAATNNADAQGLHEGNSPIPMAEGD